MRKIASLALLGAAVGWGSLAWAESYPREVQRALEEAFAQEATRHLQKTVERYNAGTSSTLESAAKAAGLSEKEAREIARTWKHDGPLPKAEFQGSQLVLRDAGVTITMGSRDFERHEMRVNGKPFAWNTHEPLASNLKKYNALFQPAPSPASHASWHMDLLPSAWADVQDLVAIQVAGLKAYFEVYDTIYAGEQMFGLNAQVESRLSDCEGPAAVDDTDLKKAIQNTSRVLRDNPDLTPMPLNSCDAVKGYAASHFTFVDFGTDGLSSAPYRMPTDLCLNIDRLARCLKHRLAPASAASTKKKPADWNEWRESSPPAAKKAGSAR